MSYSIHAGLDIKARCVRIFGKVLLDLENDEILANTKSHTFASTRSLKT